MAQAQFKLTYKMSFSGSENTELINTQLLENNKKPTVERMSQERSDLSLLSRYSKITKNQRLRIHLRTDEILKISEISKWEPQVNTWNV